jgi:hypothetical protein
MAKEDSSWKNVKAWAQGKTKLEHGLLQHPEEDAGDKSVFNFIKNSKDKSKDFKILLFNQYENLGKIDEDMLSPADGSGFEMVNPESPGSDFQHPGMMPQPNMDKMSLSKSNRTKSKKTGKIKKKKNSKNSVMTFKEFLSRIA